MDAEVELFDFFVINQVCTTIRNSQTIPPILSRLILVLSEFVPQFGIFESE